MNKKHELTKTNMGALLKSGAFEFTCPICGEVRVYAQPKEPEYVFCDGLDFGTKVDFNGSPIEVSEYLVLLDIAKSGNTGFEEIPENVDIDKLLDSKLVENDGGSFKLPEEIYNETIWQ